MERPALLAACAALLWLPIPPLEATRAFAQLRGEYLEPEDGVFAPYGLNSYYAAVSETLLGQDRFRHCQMVFMPSFEPEAAVYIITSDEPKALPVVVAVEVERQIWAHMGDYLHGFLSEADQQRALARFPRRVRRVARTTDRPTDLMLQRAWEAMLLRVSYLGDRTPGLDGTTYHATHWSHDHGFLAGKVWSPPPTTAARDFVSLAGTLRAYAAANDTTQEALKRTLTTQAQALLTRLGVQESE